MLLIWEKPITNCNRIFQLFDKIIEMDLTHFDISQVREMIHMFDEQKPKVFKYF